MKKLLAAILAVATVASVGVTAFAKDPTFTMPTLFVSRMLVDTDGKNALIDPNDPASDVLFPGKALYGVLAAPQGTSKSFGNLLTDKKLVSSSLKKEDGKKLLKSATLTQQNFSSEVWRNPVWGGDIEPDYLKTRSLNVSGENYNHLPAIKFVFTDFVTDDEQKVSGYLDVKFKKNILYNFDIDKFIAVDDEEDCDIKAGSILRIPFEFWVNNKVLSTGDMTMAAGRGGEILKPSKNDENDFVWENENNTLATLAFEGDDNQTKMYSKLSTRWDPAFYEANFKDVDAFLFDFTAHPSNGATSRATLSLRCPFVDEDGELTCDEAEMTIYTLVDGELVDDTASWKLVKDDNDGYVFTKKVRTLGTYIIVGPKGASAPAEEEAPVKTGIVLSAYAQ